MDYLIQRIREWVSYILSFGRSSYDINDVINENNTIIEKLDAKIALLQEKHDNLGILYKSTLAEAKREHVKCKNSVTAKKTLLEAGSIQNKMKIYETNICNLTKQKGVIDQCNTNLELQSEHLDVCNYYKTVNVVAMMEESINPFLEQVAENNEMANRMADIMSADVESMSNMHAVETTDLEQQLNDLLTADDVPIVVPNNISSRPESAVLTNVNDIKFPKSPTHAPAANLQFPTVPSSDPNNKNNSSSSRPLLAEIEI